MIYSVKSISETHALAAKLAKGWQDGSIVGLYGNLGAGKTEFVRGLVESLGIVGEVISPTYVLEAIYKNESIEIHHWDLYRVNGHVDELGIKDLLGVEGVLTIIEWPERVEGVEDLLSLKIVIDSPPLSSDETRDVTVE